MTKTRCIAPVVLVLLTTAFALGVVHLFQLRFEGGDIYPPYSSLRADPLGVKVFYQSLAGLPGLSVSRFYQASNKLTGNKQRVLFLFGVDKLDLDRTSEADFEALQTFLFNGGRVVISLLPSATHEFSPRHAAAANDASETIKMVSLFDKVGAQIADNASFIPDAAARWAGQSPPADGLPDSISWHSAAYFRDMDTNWRTLYQQGKHAVIIERSFGPGSLALSADSYFVSNEALRRERHSALLAWLTGGRRDILFDETHLGVEEHPGVGTLLREYHLEGLLLGLLLVAGLFVWKNSAPLLPPFPDEQTEGRGALVQGRESSAGFASLLRRSIPPSEILRVCFAEWQSACGKSPRAAARLAAIEKIVATEQSLAPGARRPAEAAQAIRRLLTERI